MVDVSALALVGKINEAAEVVDDIECCDAATNDGRLRTASRFSSDAMMTMLCGRKLLPYPLMRILVSFAHLSEYTVCLECYAINFFQVKFP